MPNQNTGPAPYDHPPCVNPDCCGPVIQKDGELRKNWRKRKTCSRVCWLAHMSTLNRAGNEARARVPRSNHSPFLDIKPRIIRELDVDFNGHNLSFKRHSLRLSGPELNYSPSGSSMGWASSRSGEGAI